MSEAPQGGMATPRVAHCAAYADGRKVREVPIDDISEVLKDEGQFVWIAVCDPDEPLMRKLQEEFGLHDLAVEDAHRAHQRPKLEEYEDSVFVVLRTVQLANGSTAFGETHVFIGPRYVVAVRHGAAASQSYGEVRLRCEKTPHLLRQGPGFALYAIMDFVVDHYFPVVDGLEEMLDELEEEIFDDGLGRTTTARIYALKRNVMALKHAVSPLIDVCNRLVRLDVGPIHEDTRVYFRDVYDHVIRINEAVDNLREMLSAALEANLSLVAVGQNEVTKKLAAVAAMLAVPTMIAGIYGMNFQYMPELHWRWSYPLLMGGLVAACGYLYGRFKRSGWL